MKSIKIVEIEVNKLLSARQQALFENGKSSIMYARRSGQVAAARRILRLLTEVYEQSEVTKGEQNEKN